MFKSFTDIFLVPGLICGSVIVIVIVFAVVTVVLLR